MKAPHVFTSITVAIALLLTSGISVLPNSSMEANQSSVAKQPLTVAIRYVHNKPRSRGTPGRAGRGAGSRSCLTLAKVYKPTTNILNSLNALIPEYKTENEISVWGSTLSERPTLWFYIPYKSSRIESIELVLQDNVSTDGEGQTVQTIPVAIPQTTGIIGVTLPSNKPGLELDKYYKWYLKVTGNCADKPIESVEGWITRTKADVALANQLKQLSSRDKAALLAEKGIWYDALTTLAELRRSEPQNGAVNADWNTLLKETNMEALTSAPLVEASQSAR